MNEQDIRKKLRGRMRAVKDLLAREVAETERIRKLRIKWDKDHAREIEKAT